MTFSSSSNSFLGSKEILPSGLELIEKLRFLAETSSIDISRIYISGRSKDGKALDLYIQSNGIVAANDAADYILSKINTLIERCLFG